METSEKIYREKAKKISNQTLENLSQLYSPKTISQVSKFMQSLNRGQFYPEFVHYSAKD